MILLTSDDRWMLPCMSKQLLKMDCPGCGIQRAIAHLLRGEVADAFFMYPGIFPLSFLFVFLAVDWFYPVKGGEQIKIWATILTIGTIVTSYLIKIL